MNTSFDAGYIKLYRGLVDDKVFANADLLKIWLWCLLKTNHQQVWVAFTTGKGKTEVEVQRGEFIFGSYTASRELGYSPSKCYSLIRKLERMGKLKRQVKAHYTIVKIIKYHYYQAGGKVVPKSNLTVPKAIEPEKTETNHVHPLLCATNKTWLKAIQNDYTPAEEFEDLLKRFCAANESTNTNLYKWRSLFSEYLENQLNPANSN